MYNFVRKVIVAFVLAGGVSGAFAAENLPPQVEQIKKVLLAEKEQWAYVQKVLQLSKFQPKLDKMHVWMRNNPIAPKALAWGCGLGFFALMLLFADKCGFDGAMENLDNRRALFFGAGLYAEVIVCFVAMAVLFCALLAAAGGAFVLGDFVYFWLEQKPDVITTLQVFVVEWQKHREKFPSVLRTIFDNLHAQQKDNCDLPIDDYHVLKLVQEVAALAAAAQHS